MAEKNLHIIKKAIYDKLKNDSTLTTLLGGNKIYFERNPNTITYPAIVYGIITDVDNIYNEDISDGKITETTFHVTIFSNNPKSEESDNLESRVKTLLHGQRKLDGQDIACFGCFKQYSDQRFDAEGQVWVTASVFRLSSAPK